MSQNLNRSYVLSAMVLAFFCITFFTYSAFGAVKKSVVPKSNQVAVMLDLSGAQSTLGQQAMNGFLLALQQLQGSDSVKAFFSLNNTQSDLKVAKTISEDLINVINIGAGFTDNNAVIAIGSLFQHAKIPFLSIGATDPSLPQRFGNMVFLVPFGDNAQAAAAAEFSYPKLGDTVAILWDSSAEYTTTLPKYFKTRFEELGGKVLLDESYDGGCNLSTLAKKIKAVKTQPKFIYLAGLPSCIGKTINSLRQADIKQPIIGGDGLDTPNLWQNANGSINDVWFTTHAWISEKNKSPSMQQFLKAYSNQYGQLPSDAFAALGYDTANLIVNVINRAASTTPLAIINALEGTQSFEGLTGDISYSKTQHVPKKTVWVIHINNGKRQLADHFTPMKVPPALTQTKGHSK